MKFLSTGLILLTSVSSAVAGESSFPNCVKPCSYIITESGCGTEMTGATLDCLCNKKEQLIHVGKECLTKNYCGLDLLPQIENSAQSFCARRAGDRTATLEFNLFKLMEGYQNSDI